MSFGRLSVSNPLANTDTVVYTAPDKCFYSEVTLNILNTDTTDITIQVAVSTDDTPDSNEYIEKGAIIPANGGILERTNLMLSPGERIVVRSTLGTTIVRVSGKEVTSV